MDFEANFLEFEEFSPVPPIVSHQLLWVGWRARKDDVEFAIIP
jgi:hypothetical protein